MDDREGSLGSVCLPWASGVDEGGFDLHTCSQPWLFDVLIVTDSGVDSFVFFLRDETFPLRGNELSGVAHT